MVGVHREAGEAQFGELSVDIARAAAALGDAVPPLEREALVDPALHGVAQ